MPANLLLCLCHSDILNVPMSHVSSVFGPQIQEPYYFYNYFTALITFPVLNSWNQTLLYLSLSARKMMDKRFNMQPSRENTASVTLQKKIVESRRPKKTENVPDITDLMNDMFFGTVNAEKKVYNLTGSKFDVDEEEGFDYSTRSNSSRLTQEWLEEARRMVASSPTRCESPGRLVGSPRFAAVPGRLATSTLDRRDPLSRSARRHRAIEGLSEEILVKSAKHSRNKSESLDDTYGSPSEPSPASQVQKWFTNILKPSNLTLPPEPTSPSQSNDPPSPSFDLTAPILPPRQSTHRRSRFQTAPSTATTQGMPVPPRRSFRAVPLPNNNKQVLSPPKNLVESAQRRSFSASTCLQPESKQLSPPRNIVESAHRRSISRNTCSIERIPGRQVGTNGGKGEEEGPREISVNGFLKEQRIKIDEILNRQIDSKAKVILSSPSNSTSSMTAAICYAWLLEKRLKKNEGESNGDGYVVVPMMNVRRGKMWNQRQAAWLFHHVGLDASSLLFADEVDLESLMMSGKLNIIVVGQDILRSSAEVGSQCTVLTDNYCEDAYDLLQTPVLKKLLLAGILLDTQNLNATAKIAMTRDAEAVQLLLVGSAPNYRHALYDQLMQDQRDSAFCEALERNYGKPPRGRDNDTAIQANPREAARKSTSVSRNQVTAQNSDDVKHAKTGKDTQKSGGRDNDTAIQANPREAARKSTSVSRNQVTAQNSDNVKHAKTGKDTQKSAKPNASKAPTAAPTKAAPEASHGKNKFFLAKWFGFGSK